jgi:hypothetical protein
MLLSHLHQFIFLKPRKTAGTSIEILLSSFMGRDDVITPTNFYDELARLEYNATPRNFIATKPIEPITLERLRQISSAQAFTDFLNNNEEKYWRFYDHMAAAVVKSRVPPIVWDNYFKISMTRHPYEVIVSGAYYYQSNRILAGENISHSQLLSFIDQILDNTVITPYTIPNYSIYSINDKIVANHIIRHEHLEEDTQSLFMKLGLHTDKAIPRLKTQFRQDRRPAHEILSVEQKKRIYDLNRLEFEAFGYQP